jgi:hypothetical protein
MKALGGLDPEARKATGQALNQIKDAVGQAIEARKAGFAEAELEARLAEERVDVTLPARPDATGHIHPISQTMEELVAIARSEEWPGYIGSPRLASAAHGAQSWSAFETMFIDLALRILDGFDYRQLPRYTDIMGGLPEIPEIDQDALDRDAAILRQQQDWLAEAELE